MKCKICGCEEFIGHQIMRADILVDEDGEFLDNLKGGLSAHVYDSERPYGPFTCTRCGAEYDELKDGEEPISPPDPDWQTVVPDHKKATDIMPASEVFRWLADHDNTDEMFRIFAEMDLDGVLKQYDMPEIIQRVSDWITTEYSANATRKLDRLATSRTDSLTGILKGNYDLEKLEAGQIGDERYIQNVLAISRDGSDVYTMVLSFETPSKDFDIERAVVAASTEFCKRVDGKEVYEHNCESFNWADFDMHVPNEICAKYGFRKIGSKIGTMEVNWDSHLVHDSELEEEDD